jgi:hypothetical protein
MDDLANVLTEIMYIELTGGERRRTEWAHIGRVSFSKTGKTIYYDGRRLNGMGRGWYRDEESGETFWAHCARADGRDRGGKAKLGSFPVAIDEDVRKEYWNDVRGEPERSHERVVHS